MGFQAPGVMGLRAVRAGAQRTRAHLRLGDGAEEGDADVRLAQQPLQRADEGALPGRLPLDVQHAQRDVDGLHPRHALRAADGGLQPRQAAHRVAY